MDGGGSRDAATDAGLGDGGTDGGGSSTDAGPRSCGDALAAAVATGAFDVDPEGADGQIHAAALFDGERVRVVYNVPDAMSTFDVWWTTIECDASTGTATKISTTDANETDPVIALSPSDDRWVAAWTSDDGTGGTDNLHAYYRLFTGDGTPLGDSDLELRTMREGASVLGNHFATAAVPLAAGGFAIAGVRGLAEIDRFHAYAQRIDIDGALLGEALEPILEPDVGHFAVTATASPSTEGALIMAWDRDEASMMDQVWFGDASGAPAPELAIAGLARSSGPSLAADPSDATRIYGACAGDVIPGATDVRLTDLGRPSGERPVEILGAARVLDFAPVIAVARDGGGGAVAYYRNVSGLSNALIVQRFDYDGTTFTVGPELEVVGTRAAPYAPALTHVLGDTYLVAWSEGPSPTFRLRARFVTPSRT